MLTLEGCRIRQNCLREKLIKEDIEAVVLTHHRDIYYFTGILLC